MSHTHEKSDNETQLQAQDDSATPLNFAHCAFRSIRYTLNGAAPGGLWYFLSGTTQPLVIMCLGAFVGFLVSLPGMSLSRAIGLTFAAIIDHNVPGARLLDDAKMVREKAKDDECHRGT